MQSKRLRLVITVVPLLLLLAVLTVGTNLSQAHAASATSTIVTINNGLASTPPMGWNDWNKYGCSISDSLVRKQADAMVSSGMQAAGYKYINIDDCWETSSRDSSGNLVADPNKFPNGIKAVADYVHSKGLKLGIYNDAGTKTCAGYPGMYGHEQQDANQYASWGIDYIKVDWCNTSGLNAQTQYTNIHNALANTGRAIVFSLCSWGQGSPWLWGASIAHLWRTTGDISDNWSSMINNFDSNSAHASYAGPGGWNDPDMLEVGNGGMSATEYQTHFSLWAISAAPLITGTDLTNMSASTKSILTNSDVIAVDQDALGIQGTKVSDSNGLQVWSKKLQSTNTVAVVLLNRNSSASNITVNWSSVGLSGSASVRDLWSHSNVGTFSNSYTANVAGHGVVMLTIAASGSTGGGGSFDPNAHYKLVNRNSGKVLDVSGASTANGANVIQWTDSGATNQQWSIIAVGNNYKLLNHNSGQALDVYNRSTANGAQIDQWPDSSTTNQQWNIVSVGSGYYKLISVNSGKALDVSGASTADGTNVIQWTDSGAANQQWSIVQV
ncbi:RICIN domain-containing protein [Dictyobacter arantiisoli]|uniref:Alpha-galactosidase n=1 Tax=Dictyobacter arantiisoli TaxID=2014874 RepID=A0A5A5THA2_9CHLR|nr:RICIN domain-containing protein [Dictyobacter arantiisoli]GCF10950.1 alpha-galactosidase [Dictyobacter arantiisoli]